MADFISLHTQTFFVVILDYLLMDSETYNMLHLMKSTRLD